MSCPPVTVPLARALRGHAGALLATVVLITLSTAVGFGLAGCGPRAEALPNPGGSAAGTVAAADVSERGEPRAAGEASGESDARAGDRAEELRREFEAAYAEVTGGVRGEVNPRTGVEVAEVSEEDYGRLLGAVKVWSASSPSAATRWLAESQDRSLADRLLADTVAGAAAGRDYESAEALIDAITDHDLWEVAVWKYARELAESLPDVTAVGYLARVERITQKRGTQMIAIENKRIDAGLVAPGSSAR